MQAGYSELTLPGRRVEMFDKAVRRAAPTLYIPRESENGWRKERKEAAFSHAARQNMRLAGQQSVRISVQQGSSASNQGRDARETRRWSAAHQQTSAQRTMTIELPPVLLHALSSFFRSIRDVEKSQSCL